MKPQAFRSVAWALYIVGFAIVIGSWIRLVSPEVGWVGWIVGMAGWAFFQIQNGTAGAPKIVARP